MADENIRLLREEMQTHLAALTESTNKMGASVADLTVLVTRIEERNLNHGDGMRLMEERHKDHEVRIRDLEKSNTKQVSYQAGGWKAITVIATIASFIVGLAINAALRLIK